MAIIKICTDIEQSKKLIELGININTADLTVTDFPIQNGDRFKFINNKLPGDIFPSITDGKSEKIPAWSLAALLSVLPKIGAEEPMVRKLYYANEPKERYICQYSLTNMTSEYDNPIDACVAMIEKLNELNLL